MAKMYLMTGPSGAGKTTFAKKFAEDNHLQYLGIDDFYALINGSDQRHEDETDVWLIFYKAIQLAEQHGRDIIIDTNAPTPTKRTQFLDWFSTFEPHLIYVTAGYDLCQKNNQTRSRIIPQDQFDEMYYDYVAPEFSEDKRWQSVASFINHFNKKYMIVSQFNRDDEV